MTDKASSIRILVADDEKDIRRLIVFILNKAGYEVIEANNGQEALDLTLKTKPDVVLLDVMMPKRDGYDVCRQLRANNTTRNTPILFLSAKTQSYDIMEGMQVGATYYLIKPFTPNELVAKIKQLVGESEVARNVVTAKG